MKEEPLKDKKKNRFPSYPNVNFYDEDNVKSATDWLIARIYELPDDDRITKENVGVEWVIDLIKKAFPDLYPKK